MKAPRRNAFPCYIKENIKYNTRGKVIEPFLLNQEKLRKLYAKLPVFVFQLIWNDSNVVIDENNQISWLLILIFGERTRANYTSCAFGMFLKKVAWSKANSLFL